MEIQPLLSIVAPVFNEQDNLEEFHQRLLQTLSNITQNYEVLYIDDGSEDGSNALLASYAQQDSNIKVIELSRNFGKELAMLSGYDQARGEAVIVLDTDLQHPPEIIPSLIEKWRDGADIVDAVRQGSMGHNLCRRAANKLFYFTINKMTGTKITDDISDFRLLDHRVIKVLRECRERFRFNKGLIRWLGFRRASIPFEVSKRQHGKPTWSTIRLIQYAFDAIFSFSALPLRLTGISGLLVSLASFVYLIILIADNLINKNPMSGFATLVGGIFLLGGLVLLGMWVLGEYIARLFEEAKGRPPYIIRRTITATSKIPHQTGENPPPLQKSNLTLKDDSQ